MTLRQLWVRLRTVHFEDSWLRSVLDQKVEAEDGKQQADSIDDVLAMVERKEG